MARQADIAALELEAVLDEGRQVLMAHQVPEDHQLVMDLLRKLMVAGLHRIPQRDARAALGVRLFQLCFVAISAAVVLSALVTSAVGVIGFIGLLAPVVARLAGPRRAPALLLWSSLIGSSLLFCADAAIQLAAGAFSDFLPTGAITAIFGSPLLLLLLPRLKTRHRIMQAPPSIRRRPLAVPLAGGLILTALVLTVTLAIFLGRGFDGGWEWLGSVTLHDILPLRAPRVLAALASGAMLAMAGVLLQRLTGNEMASPEVLGIGPGATFGLAVGVFFVAAPVQFGLAAAGAFIVLSVILVFAMRSGFAPERVLLAGIALSAMIDALVGALAGTGDPRALLLMRWMSGSTYSVDNATAVSLTVAAVLAVGAAFLARRWLDLLPLGPSPAAALGLPLKRARLLLFALAGLASAAATLGVGPLSFVGLMAPHLAREAGLVRATAQLTGAAAIGGSLMVFADWLGRIVVFPYQIPAGLMSALVGAPFLVLLLFKRK